MLRMMKERSASASHSDLQEIVLQRRQSLTPSEAGFLEDLCKTGSEKDVVLARKSIMDQSIFSEEPETPRSDQSLGSTRRQSLLQAWKTQPSRLWQAHENGITLTRTASRRRSSVQQRRRSSTLVQSVTKFMTLRRKSSVAPQPSPKSTTRPSFHSLESLDEETQAEAVIPTLPFKPFSLTTKEASRNLYQGEGFEVVGRPFDSRDVSETMVGDVPGDDNDDDDDDELGNDRVPPLQTRLRTTIPRPVMMRKASATVFDEKGMEVADWRIEWEHEYDDQVFLEKSLSFDERMSYDRVHGKFVQSLRPCFSEESEDDSADELFLEYIAQYKNYNPWEILESQKPDFLILGTCTNDVDCLPHVLSPPLMESLQEHLPLAIQGENMLLKYSMVRDGASLFSLLKHCRGTKDTILALETLDGHVFGCFTRTAWHRDGSNFGSSNAFLWRMKHTRRDKSWSLIDQAELESAIDVYPAWRHGEATQRCESSLMVGGLQDSSTHPPLLVDGSQPKPHEWGFGLFLEDNLLEGTTAPCQTFCSPALGSERFEVINCEVWTLTPCRTQAEAERLELKKLFLQQHAASVY